MSSDLTGDSHLTKSEINSSMVLTFQIPDRWGDMMVFFSFEFLILLAVMLVLYYSVFKTKQWIVLLVGSMFFYFTLGGKYLILIVCLSLAVWLGARAVERMEDGFKQKKKELTREEKKTVKAVLMKKKRLVLALELVIAFGLLAFFKVADFKGSLVLPVGISFYTFQALSYFFDVYLGKYESEKNYLKYLLFVSWFPQMMQGPISRYNQLGVQFREQHKIDLYKMQHALYLFVFGFMKKYAIAEVVAPAASAAMSGDVSVKSGSTVLFGVLLFMVQEYADFSGGIDMTIAISKLFGLDLIDNFNQPYFATSMANFWRRWHITLGAWMRDYVFYPMAVTKPMMKLTKWGTKHWNRVGRILPALIGNIVVFTLVGIWHGTGWNYVLWGLYNGVLIAASDLAKPLFDAMKSALHVREESKGFHLFRILRTCFLVFVGEILVCISNAAQLPAVIRNVFVNPDLSMAGARIIINEKLLNYTVMTPIILFVGLILFFTRSVMNENGRDFFGALLNANIVVRLVFFNLCFFMALFPFVYVTGGGGGFLYANF